MTSKNKLALRICFALGTTALIGATAFPALAQQWPDKPVRVIVPLPPGGPSDIVLRGSAPLVQQMLKQPLVIDNKPGANGNIGTSEASRATPDGYTWLWTTDTTLTVNPHVYEKIFRR
jgi:tripartite-type tricarboxylate transporter receptor subunit TctC